MITIFFLFFLYLYKVNEINVVCFINQVTNHFEIFFEHKESIVANINNYELSTMPEVISICEFSINDEHFIDVLLKKYNCEDTFPLFYADCQRCIVQSDANEENIVTFYIELEKCIIQGYASEENIIDFFYELKQCISEGYAGEKNIINFFSELRQCISKS